MRFEISAQPSSTSVSKAGGSSSMYINGNLELTAGGGTGGYNYDMCDKAKPTSSQLTIAGCPAGWVTYHTHAGTAGTVGGCYAYTRHTHTDHCAHHTCGNWMRDLGSESDGHGGEKIKQECSRCGNTRYITTSGGADLNHYNNRCDRVIYECGSRPLNSNIQLTCGKSNGQTITLVSATPGACFGSFTSQQLNNTGHGKFTIRLAEQQNLYYDSRVVEYNRLSYANLPVILVLNDNTVVYFKRW